MADTEVVGKVGRGGAGNYYTKKDIEDINSKEDLEAQIVRRGSKSTSEETTEHIPAKYAHAGRGGAGNWYEPSAQSPAHENDDPKALTSSSMSTTASAQGTSSKPAIGRGGAGNWFESTSMREKRQAEEEQRRKDEEERLEKMVRESIEERLTKPPRSYGCGSERGVRVGKSRFGLTLGDEPGL